MIGAPPGTRAELTGWATGLPSPLAGIRGWTGTDRRPAPQGTAFTTTASVQVLTADIEGTVTLAAVSVLNGTVADEDWDARVDDILGRTLDAPGRGARWSG